MSAPGDTGVSIPPRLRLTVGVLRIGLTGGSARVRPRWPSLAHGAVVIDADALARKVVAPAPRAWRIGRGLPGPGLDASGGLDRAALAAVVFHDPPPGAGWRGSSIRGYEPAPRN